MRHSSAGQPAEQRFSLLLRGFETRLLFHPPMKHRQPDDNWPDKHRIAAVIHG
jgi:hypothetical protein